GFRSRGLHAVSYPCGAVMGTAAAECCEERPGDGASPGACATDQITPERPEERLRLSHGLGPSRTGKDKFEWAERVVATVRGQGGWYRGVAPMRPSSLRRSWR